MTKRVSKKYQYLFCPGPVNVHEDVRKAAFDRDIGHRESEFSTLLSSIQKKLLKLYGVQSSEYTGVVVTGSGTAANESVLSSVVGNKRILIVTNGEFGERLFHISKLHNARTGLLNFGWGKTIDLQKLKTYLKKHKVDFLMMVHHETSSGILNPIKEIGAVCQTYNITFMVDTISSAGAEKVDMKKWNISFCTGTSGKAIGAYPGLSFVVGRINDFEKLKNQPIKLMYLNLYNFYNYATRYQQTPNTPSVQLFFALDEALETIMKTGIAKYRHVIHERARMLRKGMRSMGIRFLVGDKDISSMLTTAVVPSFMTFADLNAQLKKNRIIVYNGKNIFKDKVFQVANIGDISISDIKYFLSVLNSILKVRKATTSAISINLN